MKFAPSRDDTYYSENYSTNTITKQQYTPGVKV